MDDYEKAIQAHQYLYYCLGKPVLSDHEYDIFCRDYNLDGKGGSDLESPYPDEIEKLAYKFLNFKINGV